MDLFLLETEQDIQNFKNRIREEEKENLVALTTSVHKILNKNNIHHEVVDEFFDDTDYYKIDELMTNFSLNWYKQKDVDLELDGINLGYLLETEIIHYFLAITRYIIGIQKIIKKKNPTRIFVGNIAEITKNIISDKNITIVEKRTDEKLRLDRDEIEIPLPIARTRKIRISRKRFIKTKNFFEKISSQSIQQKISSKKTILLLDFNPVFYKDLLKNFSKKFDRVILLNQRRPAMWNLESRRIIKQNHCEILRLDDFSNSEIKKEIKEMNEELKRKIIQLKDNISLEEFFKIDKICLWNIIKNDIIEILLQRSEEMIKRKTLLGKVFESLSFSVIFEWAYKGFEERIVNYNAKMKEIPVVFLQHSIIVENLEFDIFLPFQPTLPDNESKIAVYGKNSHNFVKSKGILEDHIIETGSPRHDEFFSAREYVKNDNSIILATASTFPKYKADGNDIRSYDRLEEIIQKTLEAIKKYPEKNPKIKLHPRKDYDDITSYIRSIDNNVPIYRDQRSIDIIKNCDMLISTNFSTILLEAMILGKPTIMISNKNFQNESIVKSKATIFVSEINEIDDAINSVVTDMNFRKQLIKNADLYIDEYFSNQKEASKYVASELEKIL